MSCFNTLFSRVSAALHADGRELAICVDDSGAKAFQPNATSWAYEWDWKYYLPYADILLNMGTYPGSWSAGNSYPAWLFLESRPCAWNASRSCGVKGQVEDMLALGANASSGQMQPGLWMGPCEPNGTTTREGWTQAALAEFLRYLTANDVRAVGIWTDDAMLLPSSYSTCTWFISTLRAWLTA
jgi:hypothetical protein